MNIQKAKQYTKHTILHGNKDRIAKVLKRYWNLKQDTKQEKLITVAKDIFNVK